MMLLYLFFLITLWLQQLHFWMTYFTFNINQSSNSHIHLFINCLNILFFIQVFSSCVTGLVSSLFWGCNYTADDDGWPTSAADELSIFCWVRFTSVPLHKRCCRASKEKPPLMNYSSKSVQQAGGGGEKIPFCVGDDIPRRWCHT